MGEADYKQAPAGTYTVDPDHASVIARVSHLATPGASSASTG